MYQQFQDTYFVNSYRQLVCVEKHNAKLLKKKALTFQNYA